MQKKQIQDWIDAGKKDSLEKGCRKGRMLNRRYEGKEGRKNGGIRERRDRERMVSGKNVFRQGWIQERMDSRKEGCRKGGIL